MLTFSVCKKSVIVLLLGIMSLFATVVKAQEPPRLLLLGITKEGRAQLQAEHAVQVRLKGLGILVVRPNEITAPPCENIECVAAALASEHEKFALAGRILLNEHACLATIMLVPGNKLGKSIEQDIACRPDGRENELVASLADAAAAMVEDILSNRESSLAAERTPQKSSLIPSFVSTSAIKNHWKWDWKRKFAVMGFGMLFASSLATTSALFAMNMQVACNSDTACITKVTAVNNQLNFNLSVHNYQNSLIFSGIFTAISAAAFTISVAVP